MEISIIIATMAESSRTNKLKRAIQSIRSSSSVPISIIVVVNGSRYDQDLCEWLKSQSDIVYDYLTEPSAPKAIRRGVELVQTEFYGCLDDDDELINMAIDKRLKLIRGQKNIDCVISNGYRRIDNSLQTIYSDLEQVAKSPLLNLMRFNWLASCNFIFRKSSVDEHFFNDSHSYGEWTWLAFKLCMQEKNIFVLLDNTFVINDTEDSLSKSTNYINAYISLFKRMSSENVPDDIHNIIGSKLTAAYHDASDHALKKGDFKQAFKFHCLSLMGRNGWKYLSYTRHFFNLHRYFNKK